MTGGALETILKNANLANGAAFESLRGRQMVSSIWKTTSPVPVEANFPLFMVFTSVPPDFDLSRGSYIFFERGARVVDFRFPEWISEENKWRSTWDKLVN